MENENKDLNKNASNEITKMEDDFSAWYLDVINAAGLAEHGPVRGTMIIKPYGYAIWEKIQKALDDKFKEFGIENAYFPMFIPQKFLEKEAEHVEGFAPEVAVVTHAGGQKLDEPIVIRPTSETIIYDAYKNWIRSYRDLPLLINQWANVVRWEMRPRLFLRTTEFLWQEGHTVHEDMDEADVFAKSMLDVYEWFAQEYMAIPVFKGQKSESEKFAGAYKTYSIEAMMQDGKALQFATSHNLGQNFAKSFDVKFLNSQNEYEFGYQTSFGLSTRSIGALIMTHSDNKGLVLPPKLASIHVVIVPIWKDDAGKATVLKSALDVKNRLEKNNVRVKIDDRDLRPGEKYFEWERKGVPVRIEIGMRDIENDKMILVRRDTGEKIEINNTNVEADVNDLLDSIQNDLLIRATKRRDENIVEVDNWDEFVSNIEKGKFVIAFYDGTIETEKKIKEMTKATTRCVPFDFGNEKGKCVLTGSETNTKIIFALNY